MILCIPGFLGTRSDFEFLSFSHRTLDLFHSPDLFGDFKTCAATLKSFVQDDQERILIGYSLGARLDLHALCLFPDYFSKAVIISAHTGLTTSQEKDERIFSDEKWAKRFESEQWSSVINDWNRQSVFRGHSLERREDVYNRASLSSALRDWSLGAQEDLTPHLPKIMTPILWITGADDVKFGAIAKRGVSLLPNGEHCIIGGAGHRVQWEKPALCNEKIRSFIYQS